jgi:DNA-binding GntR family transcriptional regulator
MQNEEGWRQTMENISADDFRNEYDFKNDPLRLLIPVHLKDNAAPYYIAGILREAIYRGILPEGEALYQSQLAERLSVSPIPLREALRLLEMEGLVDFQERRGAIVTGLSVENVREIYEMLVFLEVGTLRVAFSSIPSEVLDAADRLLGEMEAQSDCMGWRGQNILFHNALYESADRPITLDMMARLRRQVDRYIRPHLNAMREESQKQHRRILAAIRAKDLPAAEAALAFHLENASEELQSHMKAEKKEERKPAFLFSRAAREEETLRIGRNCSGRNAARVLKSKGAV